MNKDDDMLLNVLWSDEANFCLNGEVSALTGAIWRKTNPKIRITSPLHSTKLTVWIGFTANFIIPPFFFESTVTGESYRDMLVTHCIPFLKQKRKLSKTIFMQDGAPPHVSNVSKEVLTRNFHQVISRHFSFGWPARSPDINPCDFFLWGWLKRKIFSHKRYFSLDDLKKDILAEIETFDKELLHNVVASVPSRLEALINAKCGYFL